MMPNTVEDTSICLKIKDKDIIIDIDDYTRLKNYKWHLAKDGYIRVYIDKRQHHIHSLILPVKKGLYVDHINRNKLDNRKTNLRVCSNLQNNHNKFFKLGVSGYKGVYRAPDKINWRATITFNYKAYNIFGSTSVHECAYAYNIASLLLVKEFTAPNILKEDLLDARKHNIFNKVMSYFKQRKLL